LEVRSNIGSACRWLAAVLVFLPGVARADPRQCIKLNDEAADARAVHQLLTARQAYRACVDEPECPDVVLAECTASLEDLKETIPSFIVSIEDAEQNDIEDPSLVVDGRDITLDGSTLELDPGPHDFVASSRGLTSRVRVEAREHELNRRIEIILRTAPVVAAIPTPARAAAVQPVEVQRAGPSYLPSYVLAGAGAVGLMGFGYFALSGHSELSDLDRCKPSCSHDDVQRVHTKYHLADASLGVSVVALAAAAYLYWRNRREPVASRNASLLLDVRSGPGLAMVTFGVAR
jgi:hypothetical protein